MRYISVCSKTIKENNEIKDFSKGPILIWENGNYIERVFTYDLGPFAYLQYNPLKPLPNGAQVYITIKE